jgi:hypothetical protein
MTRSTVLGACVSVALSAASAAGSFGGRWATDPKACDGETGAAARLIVEDLTLRWREAACVIRSSYRVGDAWYMSARCIADGVNASVPIRLSLRGERLALDWPGAPTEELRRCP